MTAARDEWMTAMEKPHSPPTMDSGGVKADGGMSAMTGETIKNNWNIQADGECIYN